MQSSNNSHQPFILATVSGKGGVGKSLASVHIADTLRCMGFRTAVIDADIGLSNCATLLNETVEATVMDWIHDRCDMEDLFHNSEGLTLVTGADEPGQTERDMEWLMKAMDDVLMELASRCDFIIIDTPAGSGELSLWALDRSQQALMILVDEPAAISDVYRYCKYILNIDPTYPFAAVVNFAMDQKAAESTFQRFNRILKYFMDQEVPYLGAIPYSEEIRQSVQKQKPLTRYASGQTLLANFEEICQNIVGLLPVRMPKPEVGTQAHE